MKSCLQRGALFQRAYSLIEVLAASSIIVIALGAALSLGIATVSQEESGNRIARGLSIQENAARLFRLGLSPEEIIRLVPSDPCVEGLSISTPYSVMAGSVSVMASDIDLTVITNPSKVRWRSGASNSNKLEDQARRALPKITVYRPHTRAGH
ncbi:MAG: prepilin-type N-terminal cleavage/methylation domain-containing protein [Verrucomicrobiales bacterium]|nr:prepilin-type N-terminal cleavage/methylation domain-containing protein [Verrucomicrobiales bacterium]MEC7357195.1 prepilin-type N-terminal cleavage/methylation domain-containing protein [Verrucomicrobiota bacterium]